MYGVDNQSNYIGYLMETTINASKKGLNSSLN